nr:TetR/AcrR family transcriptional regulator [Nocardia bovistercoris]
MTAARDLLDEGGPAAVTTRALAARAEVPIGTLYQYFANREAVLRELALRIIDRADDELATRLAAIEASDLDDAVRRVLVLHQSLYRAHPELVTDYYTRRDAALVPDGYQHRMRMAGAIHEFFLARGLLRPDTDRLVTEIAVEIGDRVLELAYHRSPEGDPRVLAEVQRAMSSYLKTYAS